MSKTKIKRKKKKLNVVHIVPASPHQCGMYETARELVFAERKLGINAHIFDPRSTKQQTKGKKQVVNAKKISCPKCKHDFKIQDTQDIPTAPSAWTGDRGVCVCDLEFALKSDVIVSHSGAPEDMFKDCQVPRIHVAHGRPNSSFRIEQSGQTPIYTMYKKFNEDPRWKYMITLWEGYEQYWKLVFPEVKTFLPFVDLKEWSFEESDYDFGGNKGSINVVVTDIWRMDKTPFHVLNAFVLFAEQNPGAKIHFYGLDPNGRGRDTLLDCLKERGILGETAGMVLNLKEVYRAADMLITPHTIATRTVREALACGLNVVAGLGNPYTEYNAYDEDLIAFSDMMNVSWNDWKNNKQANRDANRLMAENSFDVQTTAKKFIELFNELAGREAA